MIGLVVAIGCALMGVSLTIVSRRFRSQPQVRVVAELPTNVDHPIAKTHQFLEIVKGIDQAQPWWQTVLCGRPAYRFEIEARHDRGIRFIWWFPQSQWQPLSHLLAVQLPSLKLTVLSPQSQPPNPTTFMQTVRVTPRLFQSRQLQFDPIDDHNLDPLAYITTAMSQLQPQERLSYQISWRRCRHWTPPAQIGRLVGQVSHGLLEVVSLLYANQPSDLTDSGTIPPPSPVQIKLQMRVIVQATPDRLSYHRQALAGSLHLLLAGQPRRLHYRSGWFTLRWASSWYARYRQLAHLYHLPTPATTAQDDLDTHLFQTLPLPPAWRRQTYEVILGYNHHRQSKHPIGLTETDRHRHTYVVGATGTGKTNLLTHQIVQDLQAGRGLAVIDPHGDLVTDLLAQIPPARLADVIYFNPIDLDRPIGINLLEIDPNLSGNQRLLAQDLVVEAGVSVLRKLFSEDQASGHRIEYILRNGLRTALELPNPTVATVFRLLNDPGFRQQSLRQVTAPDLLLFWKQEFAQAGSFQRVKMSAGVTTKIGRLLASVVTRRTLTQPQSSFDFGQVLDDGQILLCNLAKGLIGEDTSHLLGATILAKIQLAAVARAQVALDRRRPFYLYIDEWQNFATPSVVELLSEARKYNLSLTLAQQSTQQQTQPRLTEIILANVGTLVTFRTGSPADAQLLLPALSPQVTTQQLMNLPAYHFYCKVNGLQPQPVFSGVTARPITVDPQQSHPVIDLSRRIYGVKI